MRKISILVLLALTVLHACKENEPEPDDNNNNNTRTPILDIQWGYQDFVPGYYADQETLSIDSLSFYSNLAFQFTESNLNAAVELNYDSVFFSFELSSNADIEQFSTRNNAAQYSKSVYEFGNYREVAGECYIPVKISNTAVPGNDTLEVASPADILEVQYISEVSSLTGSSSVDVE